MPNNRDSYRDSDPSVVVSLFKWGWRDEQNGPAALFVQVGDADLFLLSAPAPFGQIDVHSVVEDTISALPGYISQGYTIAVEPFVVGRGKCAVVQDIAGNRICILEKPNKINAPALRH
jgi:hypothetical protein